MSFKRTQIFVSYSHADSEHLQRLKIHLRPFERQSQVDVWSDTKIKAGQQWRKEIENALERAAVAILLISADFLASDFVVDNELPPLLEAAKKEGVKILPIILKPCSFSSTQSLSQFQAINDPKEPLISQDEAKREQYWVSLAESAKEAIKEFEAIQAGAADNGNTPMFSTFFGMAEYLIGEELRDPSSISEFHVYRYEHIDILEFMPKVEAVLQNISLPQRGQVIDALKQKFKESGWEGDGVLRVLWLPPFAGAGIEDTSGVAVWFVKQSNNGTAFLASPVPLPFSRLLEQQYGANK